MVASGSGSRQLVRQDLRSPPAGSFLFTNKGCPESRVPNSNTVESEGKAKPSRHLLPVSPYVLQCNAEYYYYYQTRSTRNIITTMPSYEEEVDRDIFCHFCNSNEFDESARICANGCPAFCCEECVPTNNFLEAWVCGKSGCTGAQQQSSSDGDEEEVEMDEGESTTTAANQAALANMPPTVQHIFALAVCFAQDFDKNEDADNLIREFYKPFYDEMMKCYKSDGTFLEATNYELLLRSMPSAMGPLKGELEEYVGLSDSTEQSNFLREAAVAAFTVGDGCLHIPSNRRIARQDLAIKDSVGGDTNIKRYLRLHGWKDMRQYDTENETYRYVGLLRYVKDKELKDLNIGVANDYLLSFKKFVWMTIVAFAKATNRAANTPLSNIAHQASAIISSSLNQNHGCYYPMSFYLADFRRITELPCMFDISVSGMLGSDGSVGSTANINYSIYQSNQRFIVALATIMHEQYGVTPTVYRQKSNSIRRRPCYQIRLNANDTKKILPRMASFDLNRADQHLVLLLRMMARHSSGVRNVNKVKAFLSGLGKYIRSLHPS
eukprot:scaffold3080_cov171-Skeletonema_dohrnii-CCMP3373.AAC.7